MAQGLESGALGRWQVVSLREYKQEVVEDVRGRGFGSYYMGCLR